MMPIEHGAPTYLTMRHPAVRCRSMPRTSMSVSGLAFAVLFLCGGCAADGSASASGEVGARARGGRGDGAAANDSGPPEFPRVILDTKERPSSGRRISVAPGGDLQGALDDARPGDVIVLQAGAQYVGAYVLPRKKAPSWITIESSDESALPPESTRIDPASSPKLAKLVTPSDAPALSTAPGSHHYRIVGVEITAAANVTRTSALVQLGGDRRSQQSMDDVPHDLIIDRSYIHG